MANDSIFNQTNQSVGTQVNAQHVNNQSKIIGSVTRQWIKAQLPTTSHIRITQHPDLGKHVYQATGDGGQTIFYYEVDLDVLIVLATLPSMQRHQDILIATQITKNLAKIITHDLGDNQ